jgi:hypothetical protein
MKLGDCNETTDLVLIDLGLIYLDSVFYLVKLSLFFSLGELFLMKDKEGTPIFGGK